MISLVLLCCLGALVSSAPQKVFYDIDLAHTYFEDFVKTHNKEYKSEAERKTRFEIFKVNLEDINSKNSKQSSAVYGITQFTDMSSEEFIRQYTGCAKFGGETQCTVHSGYNGTLGTAPDYVDWRTQNAVTSVKFQDSCGSCWAFSAAGAVEGQYAIKTGQLVDLSPQQILDCTSPKLSCDGGFTSDAIVAAQNYGGLEADQDYPYMNKKGTCSADPIKITARITGCRQFMFNSESEVKETLAQVGPITIGINANLNLHNYVGGIFSASECGSLLNHAVLLVGYGSVFSWGATWGEQGYLRMSMNQNTCNFMSGIFVTAFIG